MIVNQNEQLKVYEEISQKLFDKDEQVQVAKPITFINKVKPSKKVDIALIDEAHLLLTQRNQAYAKYGKNMLEDILKRAKVVMAVYDPAQVLSIASVLEDEKFADLERKAGKENVIYLKNQMRIDASQATIDWLRNLIDNGIINKIPQDSKYQIKVFKTPEEMQKAIEKKNKDQKMELVEWSQLLIGNIQEEKHNHQKIRNIGKCPKVIGICHGTMKLINEINMKANTEHIEP